MDAILHQGESKNRKRSILASIAIHILIFLLFLIPLFRFPIPPPGQQGILVSLGEPDEGEGEAVAEASSAVEKTAESDDAVAEKEPVKEKRIETSTPSLEKEVITDTKAKEVAISEEEKQRRKEAEAIRIEQQRLEEERRKAAEAEARKQAEYERKKDAYGSLFGSGEGKGSTGTEGNQGDPQGDPNAKALEGISSGSGMVGGGLGDRGVLYEPTISDRSQKVGRVVIRVCVNSAGEVISADYTQRGSTTTDAELRQIAERGARQFRFTPSDVEKQCGTITVDFKVK